MTRSRAAISGRVRPMFTALPRSASDYRPVRRARRSVCPRVRRNTDNRSFRRRAGFANILRARPDRAATSSRRLSGAGASGRGGQRHHVSAYRNARPDRHRWARSRYCDTPSGDGRDRRASCRCSLLGTGGYGNVFYLSTNAKGSNVTAAWRAHKRGALFANPCFTQIHPTCIPVSGEYQSKLTLMSESLRNDGRIWVPKRKGDKRSPDQIPERRARLLPGAPLSELRQSGSPRRRIPERQEVCDEGRGVGETGLGVYLDFGAASIQRLGRKTIEERYGNLFDMYQRITDEDPYRFRCASTRPFTTPWAASGWITT
jgi:hypothetical protein